VSSRWRRAHYFDAFHPTSAGDLDLAVNPRLVSRGETCHRVIAAGARLNELTSQGYSLFDIPVPQMTLVHAYPGAEELGRVYRAQMPIHASPQAFAAALAQLKPQKPAHDLAAAHQAYLDWSDAPLPQPGAVNLSDIMIWLRDHLAPDSIICNG